jgi:hypothetical protein
MRRRLPIALSVAWPEITGAIVGVVEVERLSRLDEPDAACAGTPPASTTRFHFRRNCWCFQP